MKTNSKIQKILYWSLTGIVAVIFIGSAMGKFFADDQSVQMAKSIGLSTGDFSMLGALELIGVLLFIVPRTGVLGTLILTAYMGGAIATHLTHELPVMAPALIEAFIWITAVVRFPELRVRLFKSDFMQEKHA